MYSRNATRQQLMTLNHFGHLSYQVSNLHISINPHYSVFNEYLIVFSIMFKYEYQDLSSLQVTGSVSKVAGACNDEHGIQRVTGESEVGTTRMTCEETPTSLHVGSSSSATHRTQVWVLIGCFQSVFMFEVYLMLIPQQPTMVLW